MQIPVRKLGCLLLVLGVAVFWFSPGLRTRLFPTLEVTDAAWGPGTVVGGGRLFMINARFKQRGHTPSREEFILLDGKGIQIGGTPGFFAYTTEANGETKKVEVGFVLQTNEKPAAIQYRKESPVSLPSP